MRLHWPDEIDADYKMTSDGRIVITLRPAT